MSLSMGMSLPVVQLTTTLANTGGNPAGGGTGHTTRTGHQSSPLQTYISTCDTPSTFTPDTPHMHPHTITTHTFCWWPFPVLYHLGVVARDAVLVGQLLQLHGQEGVVVLRGQLVPVSANNDHCRVGYSSLGEVHRMRKQGRGQLSNATQKYCCITGSDRVLV